MNEEEDIEEEEEEEEEDQEEVGDDQNQVLQQQNVVEQQNNVVEQQHNVVEQQQNIVEEQRTVLLDNMVEERVTQVIELQDMLNLASRITALEIFFKQLKERKDKRERDASREESSGSNRLG